MGIANCVNRSFLICSPAYLQSCTWVAKTKELYETRAVRGKNVAGELGEMLLK